MIDIGFRCSVLVFSQIKARAKMIAFGMQDDGCYGFRWLGKEVVQGLDKGAVHSVAFFRPRELQDGDITVSVDPNRF